MEKALPDNIRWIWFDLDDTLYDFAASSLIALGKVYDQYNLGRSFASLEEWIDVYHRHNRRQWDLYNHGLTDQHSLRYHRFLDPLIEGGFTTEEAEAMVWKLDRDYLDYLGATGLLLPHAREAVTHLRARGYHIGILSNGFTGVQNMKIQTSGLAPLIDCMVLSDEAGVNKPDRRIFDFALRKAAATFPTEEPPLPQQMLMVGDNPETDIAGAIDAGWNALLYHQAPTEHPEKEPPQEIAAINSLSEALNW